MKFTPTHYLSVFLLTLLTAIPVSSAHAAKGVRISKPVTFTPHRAIYEISLVNASSSSGISGLRGRLVFELGGSSCQGYTINMRFVTQITDQHSSVNVTDLRTSSWESKNSNRFRFSSSEYTNAKLKLVTSGDAVRSEADKKISIQLKRPQTQNLEIPTEVMFPTQHSIEIIKTALSGGSVLQADLYDGSEKGVKVFSTTAIIGKKRTGGKGLDKVGNDEILNKTSSWPVSIGYFDKDVAENVPSYQIAFRLYENGVSRKLIIDYGNFSIKGTLKKIDFFPAGKCK
ncbi:MAG: cell envelope integrity EipB family protein [Methyloligellaceae bacterium]